MSASAVALEAVLFASGEPLSKKRLASLLDIAPEAVERAIRELSDSLANRGLRLIEAGNGMDGEIELRTAPEAAPFIQKLRESELSRDLGKAGLEALSVILYKEGATRGEIDWVRGVNSAAALRSLSLRGLIHRSEDANDRRRIRYTATVEALAHLGVSDVKDLPQYAEMAAALSGAAEPAPESMIISSDSFAHDSIAADTSTDFSDETE